VELFDSLLVVTEILLTTDEDDGKATAEMQDFGDPLFEHVSAMSYLRAECRKNSGQRYLFLNVIERVGGVDSKADENDV